MLNLLKFTPSSAFEEKKPCLNRILNLALWASAIITIFLYANLHRELILEPQQLTLREYAFIDQSDQLLRVDAPPMYSYESLPEHANLYGPIYPMATAALVSLMRGHPVLAHRLFVAGCLVLICLVLGRAIHKRAGALPALLSCVYIYSANVASTSISPCSDLLMVLFYLLAVRLMQARPDHRGNDYWLLGLGVLIFFTKPYGILVIGGYLSYLALFVSPRRAFGFLALAITAAIVIAAIVSRIWPAYWFSVMVVHKKFATHSGAELIHQSIEFGYLNFGLILAPVILLIRRNLTFKMPPISLGWNRPLLGSCHPDPAAWMALVAAFALLSFMGWHSGAYLTYFNHLLLPPLLLTCFTGASTRSCFEKPFTLALLFVNLALLIWLRPPAPNNTATGLIQLKEGESALIDPIAKPFFGPDARIHIIDNGQSEYVAIAADQLGEPTVKPLITNWQKEMVALLEHRKPTYIIINFIHQRKTFAFGGAPSAILLANYDPVGTFDACPYFLNFRKRSDYGKDTLTLWVFKRKAP